MENSVLGQQISQRGFDTSRINSLMNTANSDYFSDWKGKANNLYQQQLTKYSSKLQEEVAKKIGDEGQAVALLSTAPEIYKGGVASYKIAPKFVKKTFDVVGRNVGLKNPNEKNIKSNANDMKSTLRNPAPQNEEYEETEMKDMSSSTPVDTQENIMEQDPESLLSSSRPTETTNVYDLANEPIENNLPVNNIQSEENAESLTDTAKSIGKDIAKKELDDLPEEEALDDTGIGAPVGGALAVGLAVGEGIKDLVEKHKDPKAPSTPAIPPPMTNRYSLSTSILPNTSNLSTTPSVMTF